MSQQGLPGHHLAQCPIDFHGGTSSGWAWLGCQPSYFGPSPLGLAQVKASWKSMRLSALWPGFIWFCFTLRHGTLFGRSLCFVCTFDFLKLLQLKSASLPAAAAASYYFRRVRHLQASRKLFNMLAKCSSKLQVK